MCGWTGRIATDLPKGDGWEWLHTSALAALRPAPVCSHHSIPRHSCDREELEEIELGLRLRGDSIEPGAKLEIKTRKTQLEEQCATLTGLLSAVETEKPEEVDLEAAAAAEAEAEAAKAREGGCSEMTKTAVTILKNTISGCVRARGEVSACIYPSRGAAAEKLQRAAACVVEQFRATYSRSHPARAIGAHCAPRLHRVLTIYLYFMDLISDYQVTMLYYDTGAYRFAAVSLALLVGQFAVVWMRVLPYLQVTYGTESTFCARAPPLPGRTHRGHDLVTISSTAGPTLTSTLQASRPAPSHTASRE